MAKEAGLEPIARRLYADGMTLEQIAVQTGVSATSLWKWKNKTKDPTTGVDEWDRGRQQKRTTIRRLKDLFERELTAAEAQEAGSISAPATDALAKFSAMIQRWDAVERAQLAAEQPAVAEIDRPKLFLEMLEWMAGQLKVIDPEGLKVLARNFDELTTAFKAENAAAS